MTGAKPPTRPGLKTAPEASQPGEPEPLGNPPRDHPAPRDAPPRNPAPLASASGDPPCDGGPPDDDNPAIDGRPILVARGVSKSYAGKMIIKKAELSLEGGSVLALTGPSGIGKSTLLEIMAGLVKPDSGTVSATGRAALMFQDDALIPWLGALDNLLFIADPAVPKTESLERAESWLDYFELGPRQFPGAMSGGMRRRLNLARALFARRPLILLDEPFAFLDDAWRGKVAGLIAAEAGRGAAVALTDHGGESLLESVLGNRLTAVEVKGPEAVVVFRRGDLS